MCETCPSAGSASIASAAMFALGIWCDPEPGRGVGEDAVIGRYELNCEFGLPVAGGCRPEMQIADLVGFQVPFSLAPGASVRQCAARRQASYDDDAAGRNAIGPVERNRKGHLLAFCRFAACQALRGQGP